MSQLNLNTKNYNKAKPFLGHFNMDLDFQSEVWKHFKKLVAEKKVTCNHCKKQLVFNGSTTTLIRHIQNVHKISFKRKSAQDTTEEYASDDKTVNIQMHKKTNQKTTIDTFMIKKETMSSIVARLVALDGISPYTISRSKFIRDSVVRRGYVLPKNHSDIMNLVHDYYAFMKQKFIKQKLKVHLNKNEKFGLTLDEWTSRRNHRYLNINIHQSNGECHNLGMIRILGSCPASRVVQLLQDKLSEFELNLDDFIGCTTDGAAVMISFGEGLSMHHQLCYNHAIHLAVIDVMYKKPEISFVVSSEMESDDEEQREESDHSDSDPNDSDNMATIAQQEHLHLRLDLHNLLQIIRKIVVVFRKSPVKNNILQQYVKKAHGKELNMQIDCKTRWNTICTMLDRFVKINPQILCALKDLNLSHLLIQNDLEKIKSILNVLQPIKLAVEALSRRDANLLSSEGIFKFLFDSIKLNNDEFSKEMMNSLKFRIGQRRNISVVSLMIFLQNPQQFRTLSRTDNFFKVVSKDEVQRMAIKYSKKFKLSEINISSDTSDVAFVEKVETHTLSEILQKNISNCLAPMPLKEDSTKKELDSYEATGNQSQNLKNILESLKCIQPTSTESERVFSLAGNVVTVKRGSLSDKSVNAICFLKSLFLRDQNL